MNKILFLDINGVVIPYGSHDFGTSQVAQLRRIVEACNPLIVITSEWRKTARKRDHLEKLLTGIRARLRGYTRWEGDEDALDDLILMKPALPRHREIAHWLFACERVDSFVILDDKPDMGPLQAHLVKCDSYAGLTDEIANEVIERLK